MKVLDRRLRLFGVLLLLGLSSLAGGCASIVHGTRQKVEIFTDPPGATATSGNQQVTTPGVLKLSRKVKNTQIRIEKERFAAKTILLERRTSGLVWLNFVGIPAGVIGGASADASTSNDNGWFGRLEQATKGAWVGGAALPAGAYERCESNRKQGGARCPLRVSFLPSFSSESPLPQRSCWPSYSFCLPS